MVSKEIKRIVNDYLSVLGSSGIKVIKAILFGSYATGNNHPDSDIDLAIVSADFGKDRYEEGKLLLKLAWRVDPRIQPIPFSLDTIEASNWIPLIHEIKKNGVEVTA